MVLFCDFRKTVVPAILLSAALTSVGFAAEPANDAASDRLAKVYNADGFALFDRLAGRQDGNIVLSPFSIGTALAMAYAGAAGETEAEMADVLDFAWSPEEIGAVNLHLTALVTAPTEGGDARISVANALHLTDFGSLVSESYKEKLARDFDAELFADSGLDQINAWVKDKTDGKIEKILNQLDPLSVAVLLNAVYFSAGWEDPFAAYETRPDAFHLATGETVLVPTMHQNMGLRYVRAHNYDAVALPYADDRFEMILYMPMRWGGNGSAAIAQFQSDLDNVFTLLDTTEAKKVAFSMPKFTFESGVGLIPLLQEMGLDLPFDSDHADFSGITGSSAAADRIYISEAEHKALIEVNEKGTEAAAATAIEFALGAAMPMDALEEVRIDNPFLFAIADRSTGTLLFTGRVSDPRDDSGQMAAVNDMADQSVEDALSISGQLPKPRVLKELMAAPMSSVVRMGMPMLASAAGGGFGPPGTGDQFASFEDGRTLTVRAEPVSTFSVDVDTAAYSYVRRMLQAGTLPQADAVRVEEMINYFDYGYTGPDSLEMPFALHTDLFPTPWRAGTQLLRIGIQGYRVPEQDRPPANLVLLIDTSGSMDAPDKLPLLKKSFEVLLGQLTDDDTVAIVTYAGSAGIALEPTPASDKVKIRAALNDLTPGGSTAGAAGIELAYQLAEQAETAVGTNRVILATDGDFNVGIDDPDALKRFIARKRDAGIFLSVLGFGSGNLDDITMQALAQNGNGTAAYIDSFAEARKVLSEEVGASLVTIARDVKVQVEFNPAVISEYRLIGYETRALNSEDFNNDAVDAGDIGSGHAVTALYELTPVGSGAALNDPLRYGEDAPAVTPDASGEALFVKLRYKPGDAGQSELVTRPVMAADAVETVDAAPDSARFAAAVAAFGQKLRDNPALAGWDWSAIRALANGARGTDENGYRAELTRLIGLAESLDE